MKLFRNIVLLFGAALFALSGMLHPLFHCHGDSHSHSETALTAHSDCPVCHGFFQAAETAESFTLPEQLPAISLKVLPPEQPDSRPAVPHGARAPPLS